MLTDFDENELLLRAVWPRYIKPDGRISSAAFKPRSGESGISVERTGERSLPVATNETKKLFSDESGIVSVSIHDCQNAGTCPIPDPKENRPYHSQIYSTPEMNPLDPIQWQALASVAHIEISATKH